MKENNKFIAFVDLDGTLLKNDKTISEYSKEMIQAFIKKGYFFVLCSGRYSSFVKNKALKINASDYIISDNGALVYNYKTKEIIYENPIDHELLISFLNYAKDNELAVILNCFEKQYRNELSHHKNIENIYDINNFKEKVYQIIVSVNNYDKALIIDKELEKLKDFEINYKSIDLALNKKSASGYGFDLNKLASNKGNGIVQLLKYLNIDKKYSIAIGDHYNDISMFEQVALKVAMNNSYDSLKKQADYVTDGNEEDGVAKILSEILEIIEKET